MKLNEHKTGVTLGSFVGLMHVIWSVIVATGYGQALVNWKLSMHFLSSPVIVQNFSLGTAVELVVVAVIVGYIVGRIFAKVWNSVHS